MRAMPINDKEPLLPSLAGLLLSLAIKYLSKPRVVKLVVCPASN